MKRISSILIFAISTNISQGQDFKSEFDKYCKEDDTSMQLKILQQWEEEEPSDAELYVSYFNYYFQKSKQESLSLNQSQPEGESLSLQDSAGKTKGYIGSQITFAPKTLEKGLDKIDQGLELYPNRLDMRFGKIHALGQAKDWQKFTDEIIKTVQYAAKNNNEWTWTNNEKKEEGKEFFLSSLQSYQLTLYNTNNDNLLTNMRTIANEILKHYPDHIESLSNLSITYLLTGQYDKGIEPLLRAEEINPKDAIVLSNIAHGYKLKGDITKSIAYYEKTIKYADERTAAFARQMIEELKSID